jgi:hypothetical protein
MLPVSAVKLRGKRTEALRTHLNSPTNFAEDPPVWTNWRGERLRPAGKWGTPAQETSAITPVKSPSRQLAATRPNHGFGLAGRGATDM